MKQKWIAIFLALIILLSLTACSKGEDTTLTGMVVSVDGTVVTLMEMDSASMGGKDFSGGERPSMPEGMEGFGSFGGFEGFGDFNPEDFEGSMPEGGNFPQWGEGEMPDDLPEDFTMPEDGSMPSFGGGMPNFGDMGGNFEDFAADGETKDVDIGNAHISVEIDGGKASGSLSDLKAGVFVTITMNAKGEVTNVLISSQTTFPRNSNSNNSTV